MNVWFETWPHEFQNSMTLFQNFNVHSVWESSSLCSCIHLLSVSCTKSWYFSIVILVFCPQEWKKSQMFLFFFFFFFCGNARGPEVSLLYLTLTIPLYITSLSFLLLCCLCRLHLTAKFSVPRFKFHLSNDLENSRWVFSISLLVIL